MANRTEKAPLSDIEEMEKKPGETHEVVVDLNNDIARVYWKDNKGLLLLQRTVVLLPLVKQNGTVALIATALIYLSVKW